MLTECVAMPRKDVNTAFLIINFLNISRYSRMCAKPADFKRPLSRPLLAHLKGCMILLRTAELHQFLPVAMLSAARHSPRMCSPNNTDCLLTLCDYDAMPNHVIRLCYFHGDIRTED